VGWEVVGSGEGERWRSGGGGERRERAEGKCALWMCVGSGEGGGQRAAASGDEEKNSLSAEGRVGRWSAEGGSQWLGRGSGRKGRAVVLAGST
jgi:hypothetical protein